MPFRLAIARDDETIVDDLAPWAADGESRDRFVQLTEGVIAEEQLGPRLEVVHAEIASASPASAAVTGTLQDGRAFELDVDVRSRHVDLTFRANSKPFRLGIRWGALAGERFSGLGARHGLSFDQARRRVRLGADRRYTGPDCPAEMLAVGGIPQGDYAPAPWLFSSRPYAAWLETGGDGVEFDLAATASTEVSVSARAAAGPLRLHVLADPSPLACLRRYCRLTGMPALLPEWAYGHWKSRDVYEHQDDVLDDFEGYVRNSIPLDAVVIDSPWETQYNTWEFNPHQFPDPVGTIERMRAAGVRTVVWVTPWVNLESVDGQRPPGPESERLHAEPAPNYEPAAAAGHFVKDTNGDPFVSRWWMGTGSPVDFTSREAERWWRESARSALSLGVEGIKADDGEAWYLPPETRFADGRTGAEVAREYGALYRRSMQRALDEEHPGRGVLFGRSGWSGEQAIGMLWGGDQASDFWSLRTLVTATLTAAASGFSNWSHDVGGYLGRRLVERCPKELLIRWLQFGCFTPLMQAHGRFQQEAWTYDEETLAIYRDFVLLHERLVPYVRAAAAAAARTGVPVVRPLALTDPDDQHAFDISDAYGYGPALWVAPVLEEGATERAVYLPRGEWIDFWTGASVTGGRTVVADAPLARIPVWVRSGSLLVTYPAARIAGGLGDPAPGPLEVTLWGEPPLGRTGVRLAGGERIGYRRGRWSIELDRDVERFESPLQWRER